MHCGYLNDDESCNCTRLCDTMECVAINSNYENVYEKFKHEADHANEQLEKLRKRGYINEAEEKK